jgi:hypothetical protein
MPYNGQRHTAAVYDAPPQEASMYRQSMIQSDAHITIRVIRVLEGYKVQSTINTGSIVMSMQSPDTWAREEAATRWAMQWARYQQQAK